MSQGQPVRAHKRPTVRDRGFSKNGYDSAASCLPRDLHGIESVVLSGGQFSLAEYLLAIVDRCPNPPAVSVCTWAAAWDDMNDFHALLGAGRVASFRMLVDRSFPRRYPELVADVSAMFGDWIRVGRFHAKCALVRCKGLDIAVRTSANFNRNIRTELFESSDDASLCEFLEASLFGPAFRVGKGLDATAHDVTEVHDEIFWS